MNQLANPLGYDLFGNIPRSTDQGRHVRRCVTSGRRWNVEGSAQRRIRRGCNYNVLACYKVGCPGVRSGQWSFSALSRPIQAASSPFRGSSRTAPIVTLRYAHSHGHPGLLFRSRRDTQRNRTAPRTKTRSVKTRRNRTMGIADAFSCPITTKIVIKSGAHRGKFSSPVRGISLLNGFA